MMPSSAGRTGLGMLFERCQELRDVLGIRFLETEEIMQRAMRGSGLGEHLFLLRGARHTAQLADELADRDVPAIGNMCGHVAAKTTLVVPMRAGRPRRRPSLPIWI